MKLNCYSLAIILSLIFSSCGGKTIAEKEKERIQTPNSGDSENRSVAPAKKDDDRLPVVSAQGTGADVDWKEVEELENLDAEQNGGPGFFYNDCSQGYIDPIGSSSALAPQGKIAYEMSNLVDGNPMSAWIEGSSVEAGEFFEVKAVNVNVIYNGYQSSISSFYNNARVKKMKVFMDRKPMCYLLLEDKMQGQGFQLPFEWKFDKMHVFRFEIMETYPGKKWNDVGISELDFVLCCVAEGTEVMTAPGQKLPVQCITQGSAIMSTDGALCNKTTGNVTSFSEQWHTNLLEVHTAHHTVLATADHPFISERHGTISMYRLKYTAGIGKYTELSSTQESLLVYDDATDGFVYEEIISVKEVPGNFKTYAVQGLTSGEYYVAGGFVSPIDERGIASAQISRGFFHLNR